MERLYAGFTKERTGCIEYNHGPKSKKKPETIKFEYQSVSDEFLLRVGEVLTENKIKPQQVERIGFVIGADHGKDAFRVCFRCTVKLFGSDKLIYKTASVGSVYCNKDTSDIVEKTILNWLTEDMKKIHESKMVFSAESLDNSGTRVACGFIPKSSPNPLGERVIESITMFVTGDLAFLAMILGREGMSGHWCHICMALKKDWAKEGHSTGEKWTIQKMIDMLGKGNTGTDRKGMKARPYWDFIPIENYIIPLLHVMIGVGNDILEHFMDQYDLNIIKLSTEENKARNDVQDFEKNLKAKREELKAWDGSVDGKELKKLKKKSNKKDSHSTATVPSGPPSGSDPARPHVAGPSPATTAGAPAYCTPALPRPITMPPPFSIGAASMAAAVPPRPNVRASPPVGRPVVPSPILGAIPTVPSPISTVPSPMAGVPVAHPPPSAVTRAPLAARAPTVAAVAKRAPLPAAAVRPMVPSSIMVGIPAARPPPAAAMRAPPAARALAVATVATRAPPAARPAVPSPILGAIPVARPPPTRAPLPAVPSVPAAAIARSVAAAPRPAAVNPRTAVATGRARAQGRVSAAAARSSAAATAAHLSSPKPPNSARVPTQYAKLIRDLPKVIGAQPRTSTASLLPPSRAQHQTHAGPKPASVAKITDMARGNHRASSRRAAGSAGGAGPTVGIAALPPSVVIPYLHRF